MITAVLVVMALRQVTEWALLQQILTVAAGAVEQETLQAGLVIPVI